MLTCYLIYIGGIAFFLCVLMLSVSCKKLFWSTLSVKVNCWFCNRNHHVPYGNKNCWDCPFCEQYNGFKEDGDYNKAIPSQYDELLNHSLSSFVKDKAYEADNDLCELCNRNQLLKVKQLAAFVPQNEACFDEESNEYEKYLDSIYRLCQECQIVLHKKLAQQDSALYPKLLSWKMEQKRKRMNSPKKIKLLEVIKQVPIHARIFQLCSLCMASIVCFHHIMLLQKESGRHMSFLENLIPQRLSFLLTAKESNPELPLAGFFALIGAIFASGRYRLKKVDAVSSFLWLFMLFSHLPLASSVFPSPTDRLLFQGLSSIAIVCCTFACVFCDRSSLSCRRTWKDSRLSTSSGSLSEESCYSPTLGSDYYSLYGTSKHCKTSSNKSILDPADAKRPTLLQDCHVTTTSKSSKTMSCHSGRNLDFSLNNYLKAMKISTPKKPQSVSGIFTPRLYTPESVISSNLAIDNNRLLISPARLKFKSTHPSWVAGGYWASSNYSTNALKNNAINEVNTFSCPASPANSVSGDDRASVFSEPARFGGSSLMCPANVRQNELRKRLASVRDATFESYTSSSVSNVSSCSRLSAENTLGNPVDTNLRRSNDVAQKWTWKISRLFYVCVIISLFCNIVFAVFIMYKV